MPEPQYPESPCHDDSNSNSNSTEGHHMLHPLPKRPKLHENTPKQTSAGAKESAKLKILNLPAKMDPIESYTPKMDIRFSSNWP